MPYFAILLLSLFALLLGIVASLSMGHYPIAATELFKILGSVVGLDFTVDPIAHNIVLDIRMPRLIAGIIIGAALAVSGAAFQSIFVNPLVSPGLLGVLAGAAFGAALGMILWESWLAVQLSTLLFALLAVGFTLFLAYSNKGGSMVLMLVIGGIISSSLFTSLLSVTKYVADPYDKLPAIVYWLMGSLAMADTQVYWLAVPMLLGVVILSSMGRLIDIASLGDEEARGLGVNVARLRIIVILAATVISAMTVVIGGLIGWIGLIIPHIVRFITGPSNRRLLPVTAIVGAAFLVCADLLSRNAMSVEIPVGIVTSLIGVPVFIVVLKRAKGAW